ncbi:MAG: helicase-related protein [Hyphomicrobiaceae bacterium]
MENALPRTSESLRARNVIAVLGPTNTGKTHLAIERMLGHETGMIGLPLRLLAREVYDKIAARVGAENVALITGEEKIKPERPRYYVSTVEAMPREVDVDFLAIDEVQLAADPERGHVFTDRLLHVRGKQETLLLGAQTMRDAISELLPGTNFISRPRLSKLTYAGQKKITRLPHRTAVVAFSANEVYSVAELIRRQRGGAAVVLGALSPRTRNAQVALYQSGEVDFLVATDAIGMGLNLDVDHVAFAGVRKFDGAVHRQLTPAELGQIAGRAGRHMNDGTFGVTGNVEPFANDLIERLEQHTFDTVKLLQWRSRNLDFGSLDRLKDSLRQIPAEQRLTRARMADDLAALENVCRDPDVVAMAKSPAAVAHLWDVCQVPDYRRISSQNHAELVAQLFKFLTSSDERIPEDWFAKQVAFADRTDGDIDTLANRIAHIRTWTFVSNRAEWLAHSEHWQGRTREIEDKLSDALHEQLTQRFVDRRTSALMRGLRDKDELFAEIADDGSVMVEKHFVGRLRGFEFSPDANAEGIHGKAARNAAAHVLTKELAMRARRVASAKSDAFKLTRQGRVLWRDEEIARVDGTENVLRPTVTLIADEHLSAPDRERVQARLATWLTEIVDERLKVLVDLATAEDIAGLGRGIAFRLVESLGCVRRDGVAEEIRSLDQAARAQLRKYGVRFGAFNIYLPPLLKPAAAELLVLLWLLKARQQGTIPTDASPEPPRAGLTSVAAAPDVSEEFYRAAGFHLCGPRAVRIDMLERLADLIRPLLAWRPDVSNPVPPPKGASGDGGFTVVPEMMSILGCSAEELGHVLKALGFRLDRRPVKVAPADASAAVEQAPAVADAPSEGAVTAAEAAEPPAEGAAGQPDAAAAAVAAVAAAAAAAAGAASVAAPETPAPPAEAEEPAVAEPAFEEIWRPRRRRSGDRPRDFKRQGAGQEGRRGDRPREGGEPRQAEGSAKRPAAGKESGDRRESGRGRQDRDERRREGRHGGKPGGKPGRGRPERQPDMGVRSAGPSRKDKGAVDPDSPFAALSKLKKELEERAQSGSSSG